MLLARPTGRHRLLVYPGAPQLADNPINYFVHGALPLHRSNLSSLRWCGWLLYSSDVGAAGAASRSSAPRFVTDSNPSWRSSWPPSAGVNFVAMAADAMMSSQPYYFVYILPGFFLRAGQNPPTPTPSIIPAYPRRLPWTRTAASHTHARPGCPLPRQVCNHIRSLLDHLLPLRREKRVGCVLRRLVNRTTRFLSTNKSHSPKQPATCKDC